MILRGKLNRKCRIKFVFEEIDFENLSGAL